MSQQRPLISTSFSYETLEETLDVKAKGAQLHIGIPKEIAFQENRIFYRRRCGCTKIIKESPVDH